MAFISGPKDSEATPKRIISLVPSQTELLYDLGLDKEVIGITKFCIHPDQWFRTKTRVGGTKQLNTEIIRSLQPDLVIANKEENEKTQVEIIAEEFPVWVSDINNLDEALGMINTVGALTGKQKQAASLSTEIKNRFESIPPVQQKRKCCYLIWREPYMTVGGDTFISNMLGYAGYENFFAAGKRYPEADLRELKNSGCEVILLSSEPYPFKEKHIAEIQSILPAMQIKLVDGEMFSWYGSRLLDAPEYFKKLRIQMSNSQQSR